MGDRRIQEQRALRECYYKSCCQKGKEPDQQLPIKELVTKGPEVVLQGIHIGIHLHKPLQYLSVTLREIR